MSEFNDRVLFTQAQIVARATDSGPLITLAKKRALDPTIFDEFPPYVWQSEISSDRLDAYFTIMDPDTTLANFAADAQAGVAVLIGHDGRAAPTGYSLTGELEQGSVTRVVSDAYAISDPATAPMINKLRAGVIRDVSVGFATRGAVCACSICGRDMWRDWKCWHIPGMRYKRTDNPEDAVTDPGGELATGRIVGAHLSEYSLVYDGATPGAAVLQAQRSAEAGRLGIDQSRLLEQRYHINLPNKRVSAPGFTRGVAMDEQELRRILDAAGAPTDLAAEQRGAWLATRVAELCQLAPLAEDGRQYRADLVNSAVAEAVRAFGAEAGEKKRDQLLRFDLETIKDMTASWRDIGDSKLAGGRLSTDESGDDRAAPVGWKKVNVGGLSRS